MNRNAEVPTLRLCTGVSKYVQRGMFVGITLCHIPQNTFKGGMSTQLVLSFTALPFFTLTPPHF